MSHLYSTLPQFFHHIKGNLQLQVPPQFRSFTVSFLSEEKPPPPRSTPRGAYRSQGCYIMVTQWGSDPIQNVHIPLLAMTARYQLYTLVR